VACFCFHFTPNVKQSSPDCIDQNGSSILSRQPRHLQQAMAQHVSLLRGQGALLDLRETFPTSFMARMMATDLEAIELAIAQA